MSALVRALRKLHVNIAEIGVDDGIRLQFHCRDECFARIVEPTRFRIEHGKVIVRLEHRGVIVPKALEYGNRLHKVSLARM